MAKTSLETRKGDDDASSSSESSESSTESFSKSGGADQLDHKNTKPGKEHAIGQELAHRETRKVFLLRLLVFAVLFTAAATVSAVVFVVTKGSDIHEFKSQYEGNAKQVSDTFRSIVQEKLAAISSLAVAMVVEAEDHNLTWPFVTLGRFQERAATAQSLSKALFLGIAPYVSEENRDNWEQYVVTEANWISEGLHYQDKLFKNQFLPPPVEGNDLDRLVVQPNSSDPIFYIADEHDFEEIENDPGPGPYLPLWQTSPVLNDRSVNQNLFRNPDFAWGANTSWDKAAMILGGMDLDAPPGGADSENSETAFYATVKSLAKGHTMEYSGEPMSRVYLPIYSSFDDDRYPVATLFAVISWAYYFDNILPPNVEGVLVVLKNSCDGDYTFDISHGEVQLLGEGDLHHDDFEDMGRTANFDHIINLADGTEKGLPLNQDECQYSIVVYPTRAFYDAYNNNTPTIITVSIAIIFVFTAVMFIIYDRLVEARQSLIMRKAIQTSAIVSSLFPENVRDRLLQDNYNTNDRMGRNGSVLGGIGSAAPNNRLKTYLKNGPAVDHEMGMAPIADLFPHSTVFFADISGFTAWSSTRDPAQVFILLQAVYQAFDSIANRRKVFKVETIGDSYVAVTGLPEPQEKHAVIMARFAAECMTKMDEVTKHLEVTLGPDTSDLSMRMGMHSGPVTAGVLRGERSRFQLFGDTVNTAARMESTGKAGKIQVSQSTAELLIYAGKVHWVTPREDVVEAKGKGIMKTFWLSPVSRKAESTVSQVTDGSEDTPQQAVSRPLDKAAGVKHERLVHWIVELLTDHIKQISAKRKAMGLDARSSSSFVYRPRHGKTSLDEVAEIIQLPKFDAKAANQAMAYHNTEIDTEVLSQLHNYVSTVAAMYHDNPFHNFEHACHVTMAVSKFLKRIVAPDINVANVGEVASQIHDYTHGINSDPVAHFAIVLSGLIHDADHRGVSNAQLIKEETTMAECYRNKSVAEQNSLDLSWNLFMSEQYVTLRRCIFADEADLMRFRQVLVNVVLATDIFDKELNDLRKARWNKAFNKVENERTSDDNNLKATIVIEHIIQASDVAHTMQHWHIYQKWNKRLFHEMYKAFRQGRMGMDPAKFWYKGEIGFFDNYIIPLAKKLKDCNVFGVSSDECLNYAMKNRAEWEARGNEIVEQMVNEMMGEYGTTDEEKILQG